MGVLEGIHGDRPVFRLNYVSTVTETLSDGALFRIAEAAKETNAQVGVSGILIECAGEFMQWLEGDEIVVMRLFERIRGDPRHGDVTIVATEYAPNRQFRDWSMGCFMLDPDALPDGFFFDEIDGRKRLRFDAFSRSGDMLATFHAENHHAGLARSFASLAAA